MRGPQWKRMKERPVGGITLRRNQSERRYVADETFQLSELGPFQPPSTPDANIPPDIWAKASAPPAPEPLDAPSSEVLDLVDVRQSARTRKDWPAADAARQQLAALGWEVQDTTAGPKLRPLTPAR